jgi:hypothetical protein
VASGYRYIRKGELPPGLEASDLLFVDGGRPPDAGT